MSEANNITAATPQHHSLQTLKNMVLLFYQSIFLKPLDFSHSFGIMYVTTRKERENDRPEAILSSKITPAYDIIQKAYWINEKKIEMLDYKKKTNLLENYYRTFAKGEQR